MDFTMPYEQAIRWIVFVGIFCGLAALEVYSPRRKLDTAKPIRWASNGLMLVADMLFLRVLLSTSAVYLAYLGQQQGWGLLNHFGIGGFGGFVAGWFMLDLGLYLQHVLIHSAPTLWRIHKVHHSDLDFDVSTSVRIHPFELFLWRLFRFGAIAVSGASPAAVLFFEVMLNAQEMFIHANVNIPEEIDRKLRWAIVTPDMHRIHHSVAIAEANSNFGFHTVL